MKIDDEFTPDPFLNSIIDKLPLLELKLESAFAETGILLTKHDINITNSFDYDTHTFKLLIAIKERRYP